MHAYRGPRPTVRKFASLTLSELGGDGSFSGYASVFGEVDLGKDVIERGAFLNSLVERGAKGVRMLYQHDPNEPIGAWESIREDKHAGILADETSFIHAYEQAAVTRSSLVPAWRRRIVAVHRFGVGD